MDYGLYKNYEKYFKKNLQVQIYIFKNIANFNKDFLYMKLTQF